MNATSDIGNMTLAPAARLPFVSIIIPTFERGHLLCDTMRLALSQDYPYYEVIVVDQTPHVSDEVASFVGLADTRLIYIQPETPNLPAARNAGVAVARGDVIVFIDDDVLIGPEYIRGHAMRYADPSVGAVMGLTLAVDESDEPCAVQRALALFGLTRQMPDGAFQVQSVVGCNSSYRRDALMRAGLSDERFAGCGIGEDTDLSFRVGLLGFDLVYDPSGTADPSVGTKRWMRRQRSSEGTPLSRGAVPVISISPVEASGDVRLPAHARRDVGNLSRVRIEPVHGSIPVAVAPPPLAVLREFLKSVLDVAVPKPAPRYHRHQKRA